VFRNTESSLWADDHNDEYYYDKFDLIDNLDHAIYQSVRHAGYR